MGKPRTVTVSWPAGAPGPTVDQPTVVINNGEGATVITWVCDRTVTTLEISGLDGSVFTPSQSPGMVPQFSTTDANRVAGTYTYTVGATQASGAQTAADPRIQNGG